MKVALYARVSTEDQTLENQLQPLEAEAKRRGYEYEIFKEKESTRNTRPVKEEILSRIRRGALQGVLVWKLDRWGRSTSELALELDEFVKRGIEFVSLSDGIDLSTPQGRLQAHLLSAFAEFERDLNTERTKAGLARAKREGKKLGRHPIHCKCGKCKQSKGDRPLWISKKWSIKQGASNPQGQNIQ